MSEFLVVQVLTEGKGGEGDELGRAPTLEEALQIGRVDDLDEPFWFRVYQGGKMVTEERREPQALVWDDEQQKYVPNVAEGYGPEVLPPENRGWGPSGSTP